MAAEAAVLGTPSFRYNDFVGKLGYLEELEHRYGLTFGIRTDQPKELYARVERSLNMPNLKQEWATRRTRMLVDTIDLTRFLTWFIENYPDSFIITKRDKAEVLRFLTSPTIRAEAGEV